MVELLRPTKVKLVFLVEWTLFILFELVRGRLGDLHTLLVAVYPLGFFYVLACLMASWSRRSPGASHWLLPAGTALLLAFSEQAVKLVVTDRLPQGAAVPVVPGWLSLAHAVNYQGSWLLSVVDIGAGMLVVLWLISLAVLLGSLLGYRRYMLDYRRSPWADLAFIGLFAGCTGWVLDMVVRGHIVDFISLPGVVAADLKDIYLALGVAAFFAEALDNPQISRLGEK